MKTLKNYKVNVIFIMEGNVTIDDVLMILRRVLLVLTTHAKKYMAVKVV